VALLPSGEVLQLAVALLLGAVKVVGALPLVLVQEEVLLSLDLVAVR
jgi:hypothetical protein